MLFLILLLFAEPYGHISVNTRDSLILRQGVYSSLFFAAEPIRVPNSSLPRQYRFSEAGATPPGMKFESYPCNKPNTKVCPELASANGIYLDGMPAEPGSYTFVITAVDPNGDKASRKFTVTVQSPDRD